MMKNLKDQQEEQIDWVYEIDIENKEVKKREFEEKDYLNFYLPRYWDIVYEEY